MDVIARGDNPWKLQGFVAELKRGRLSGRLDVSQPRLGFHEVAFHGGRLDARLLCVGSDEASDIEAAAWPIADAYVRGSDLVATYRPRDDWPFSPQVYWQANTSQSTGNVLGSLSLFVSVQTHLLDTWPRINVQSQIASGETFHISPDTYPRDPATPLSHGVHTVRSSAGATCVLQRLSGDRISYVEIMPASDYREVSVRWEADGSCRTRWELFADFLEKGVIWRARLQSVFLPRENDVELAIACCRALDQQPLPLTT